MLGSHNPIVSKGGYHGIKSDGYYLNSRKGQSADRYVEYVGALISDSIKAGYVPLVF